MKKKSMMKKTNSKYNSRKILLVEPNFPISTKSKNHANFLPIGLLKLASFFRAQGHEIQLVRGNSAANYDPAEIYITSLFTYWSRQVEESIKFYKSCYPKAQIIVGGIFASLMPEHCKSLGADKVHRGLYERAEKYALDHGPAYDLVDDYGVDYQIVHAMRGCIRKCQFCGTWRIESREDIDINALINNIIRCGTKGTIGRMERNKIVFYDNNFLAHRLIKELLQKLAELRINGKRIVCESQSGFDGRLLTADIAKMLKNARFINPRIAWDHGYNQYKSIKKQIDIMAKAGYKRKEIFIFMIYNYNYDYDEMENKRKKCKQWGVQIADCRYRPLNQLYDNYKSRAIDQGNNEYYIHPKWSDKEIKAFRKNVREHNICIRQNLKEYRHDLEVWGRERRKKKLVVASVKTPVTKNMKHMDNDFAETDINYEKELVAV